MFQGFKGVNPAIWVQLNHLPQQIDSFRAELWYIFLQILWLFKIWKTLLKILQFLTLRPVLFIRRTQNVELFEELSNFTAILEQNFLLSEFCEDAANGPNINRQGIMFIS